MALERCFWWFPGLCYVTESLSILDLTHVLMGNYIYWSTNPLIHQFIMSAYKFLDQPPEFQQLSLSPCYRYPLPLAHHPTWFYIEHPHLWSYSLWFQPCVFPDLFTIYSCFLFLSVFSSVQPSYSVAQVANFFLTGSDGKDFRLYGLNNLCWNYSILLL